MEQSSSEKQLRIRKQFDSFCKTLLKNEMIDYERARSYRQKHEVSFSELTQEELSRLNTEDDYIAESEVFRVLDYDIEVKDELISEALKYLPEKKRNVILLSFFLDMTDTEIAKHMNLVRSTIHVETCVLLSHKRPDSLIHLKVEFGEGEGKVPLDNISQRAENYKPEERVTYKMIKEYIKEKYGFQVHTAYIAEVKRNLGLPMHDASNAVEELKHPRKHPTPEKVEAIKDALRFFEVI